MSCVPTDIIAYEYACQRNAAIDAWRKAQRVARGTDRESMRRKREARTEAKRQLRLRVADVYLQEMKSCKGGKLRKIKASYMVHALGLRSWEVAKLLDVSRDYAMQLAHRGRKLMLPLFDGEMLDIVTKNTKTK